MAARRSYAKSEVSGGLEELPGVRGQGLRLRGAPRGPRSVAARRRNPASEFRAAGRSHLAPEARDGGPEEPPRAPTRGGGWEEQPEELRLQGRRSA